MIFAEMIEMAFVATNRQNSCVVGFSNDFPALLFPLKLLRLLIKLLVIFLYQLFLVENVEEQ